MSDSIAVEVFPAGEHLADELDARGWTQVDFAEVLGRPAQFVSEIVSGKKEITRESAAQVAAALGTSAELWLNLQDSYLLWKQSQDVRTRESLNAVKTRSRLRGLAPISILTKRGYVKATDLEGQSREVLALFGMQSFDDSPAIRFAARRSNGDEQVSSLQLAWAACVKMSANSLEAASYDHNAFKNLAQRLSSMARNPDTFSDFQSLFAEAGVRLVYVEAFPGGKLDGCAMMVDGGPVIGVSGRGHRLDIVLFTILHEISHVLLGHLQDDGPVIIDDLSDEESATEVAADKLAGELALPGALPAVPERVSAPWIHEQAEKLAVHPITLIGRLQKDGRLSWKTTLVRDAPTVTEQLRHWKSPFSA